jgi:RNA polymerase sigma-70 factor, ECF subfamily
MLNDSHFEAIYQGHKNLVYNICLHYVLNTADAQDISQEVFVKIYQKHHQYDSANASLKTWICRITINHCLDFLRAKKTKKRFGYFLSLFPNSSNEPVTDIIHFDHPGAETENKAALQNLLQIIYNLPENQKTAIILSKIEGHSQKDAAAIMGIRVKALESLLQRAKQTIQKKITDNEGI